MPYLELGGTTPARDVELRVIGATEFELVHGFVFEDPDQDDYQVAVPNGLRTDLASVPFFLQWLVRSYGKHTRGALVHDTYWDFLKTGEDLRNINRLFRDAMRDSGTPLVRRWFVWGAVTMAGLAKLGAGGKARLGGWAIALMVLAASLFIGTGVAIALGPALVLAAALGVVAVVAAIVGFTGAAKSARREVAVQVAGIAALYAVIVAGVAWASRWMLFRDHALATALAAFAVALVVALPYVGASFIGTVTVIVVAIPTTAVFAALAVYGLMELIAYGVRYAIHSSLDKAPPAPPASKTLHRP
ncbi:MAG TPA: DUF1353 domain-containing protein [Acidimicrobiales bacterium]